MIKSISQSKINFTGKSFIRSRYIDDFSDEVVEKGAKKFKKAVQEISSENFRAYANINQEKVNLVKSGFGYRLATDSVALCPYTGPLAKNAGFSTETGGYGGGYIRASLDTPLSTTDIHTCAGMNLVNEKSNEHIFLHVFHDTTAEEIAMFIREKFPEFNRVNIIPGDVPRTNNTVNNILLGVSKINPKVDKQFYHFSSANPEVIAHKGVLSYVEGQSPEQVSFKQVDQYFRPTSYG